jgi:hypothetical protein
MDNRWWTVMRRPCSEMSAGTWSGSTSTTRSSSESSPSAIARPTAIEVNDLVTE